MNNYLAILENFNPKSPLKDYFLSWRRNKFKENFKYKRTLPKL